MKKKGTSSLSKIIKKNKIEVSLGCEIFGKYLT